MNEEAQVKIQEFNELIKHCETFCFITRDSGLQRNAITSLQLMISECAFIKSNAVDKKEEEYANILLGFECVAQCLCAELEMWIFLKEERPDEAWDRLVTAQMAAIDSVRAHQFFAHNEAQAARLEEIERLVFPKQVFVSAGMIVRHQECSICSSEYGDCDHLAGKPYWGKFCYIKATDFEADHVALVESPADKRCRITAYSLDGGQRNRMTWKIEPREFEENHAAKYPGQSKSESDNHALQTTAIVMHADLVKKRYK
ncbi:hypothetical protein [Agrobacterium cavarae]|uniref:hypothetical protein n=1 Tax=Agrobacterium cavarae TaxID=2528239 RepID=UPI0028A742AB|nr:hypothetical protein [Agrobacterium cavarae]